MKTFRDTQDRRWRLEINVSSLKRVRDETDVDLTKVVEPDNDVVPRLSNDIFCLFDVLCALLRPEFERRGLSDEQFGAALDEESVVAAGTALFEEIIHFFRRAKRTLLRRAFARGREAAEKFEARTLAEAEQQLETVDFDRIVEEALSTSGS